MSRTPDEVSQRIRDKLKTTANGLSLELGTPERKIVDAVAEAVSECYIDQYIVGSLLDIDAKGGLELEQFVGIFGFGRLQGRRATGVVRLEMNTAAPQDMPVPLGTQFYTKDAQAGTGNPLFYASTQARVLTAGQTVVEVPVECTIAGTAGNLPPDSVTYMGAAIGAATATNMTAMTGGTDVETDDQLRQRFKDTFLRNCAGTEDYYLSLALQNKNVSKAAVFGPVSTYRTQLAAPSVSTPLSSVLETKDVKYVWDKGESCFVNLAQTNEKFYTRLADYVLSSGASPTFTRIDTGQITTGEIVDLEFQYTTRSSRNDPNNNVMNKVDVFVNGSEPFTVTERTVVSSTVFSANDALWNAASKFKRVGDSSAVNSSNRIMRLGSVPILSFPNTIVVGGNTFTRNTHYWLVRGTTLEAGSPREVAGIEWAGNGPSSGTGITVSYTYNRVPEVLNAVMRKAKQVTTDVLVHQCAYAYLRINLSVEYDRGYVPSQVNNAITARLKAYLDGMRFGDWVEFSDLCLAVHQVLGVDNVWVTDQSEPEAKYGIEVYSNTDDGALSVNMVGGGPQTGDFKLHDNELPVLLDPVYNRRANR